MLTALPSQGRSLAGVGNTPAGVTPPADSFSDDFEADGGDGPLTGWTAFNPSALPDVARRNGYYDSGEIDGGDGTSWHDAGRGRADWKLQSFPGEGQPDKVYIFHNVGIGPADTPQDDLALSAPMYNFCGVVVHIADLEEASYEFCVMGHRDTVRACLESKTNIDGDSNTGNTSADVVGAGVTHIDLRLTLRSDGTIRWAYRAVGSGEWTLLFGTGITNAGGLNFGSECYIGLVTYTSGGTREPIRGTCAAVELVSGGS